MNKRKIGNKGEQLACDYLSANGFAIEMRNHYTPYGEIDLIGLKDGTLYFIEVKFRRTNSYGTAREALSYKKKKSMRASAIHYLKNRTNIYIPFKISYLGITLIDGLNEFDFIENIFE